MKKLKFQFGLFFLLLASSLGFLLINSYRQMQIEEKSLWVGMSEKVFNQMQATISDLLNQEDARSFSEYRYFQVLSAPGQKAENLTVSPLSLNLPLEDPKGLLGYFQIDPDGSFSTPYLPPSGEKEGQMPDLALRKEREKEMEGLTQSLRQEVKKEAEKVKDTKKAEVGFVDLERKSAVGKDYFLAKKEALKDGAGTAQNIYPNPLLKQKIAYQEKKEEVNKKMKETQGKTSAGGGAIAHRGIPRPSEAPPIAAKPPEPEENSMADQTQSRDKVQAPLKGEATTAKLARREVALSPAQLKAFEAKNQEEEKAATKTASSPSVEPVPTVEKPPPSLPPSSKEDSGRIMADYENPEDEKKGGFSSERHKARLPKPSLSKSISLPPPKPPVTYHPPSLLIDPFQARLVSDQYLIFYRRIWVEQKMYLQGFVVKVNSFYQWLMDQSFANSDLLSFAWAQLELGNTPVSQYGTMISNTEKSFMLFERALGYPLNAFDWKVYAESLPQLSTRLYLNLMTGIIVLLTTAGLYFIYRSAAAQVILSQKRQDFVSAVTHELKTPLTSIRMYSEMLQEGWVKEDLKRQEYYRHISQESGRLSHLIDNVLQLARLEKRNYKLNLKKEDPKADFDRMGGELRKLAEVQGFQLSFQSEENLPPVSYDPEALQEVLLVLLDNSVKFSRNGFEKSLEMTLQSKGESVVWSWWDKGPGIPATELNKVFEKFYRVENELTRNTKGTGIGLAMAKMIIETMGGRIEAQNREEGGLEIRMIFPKLNPKL